MFWVFITLFSFSPYKIQSILSFRTYFGFFLWLCWLDVREDGDPSEGRGGKKQAHAKIWMTSCFWVLFSISCEQLFFGSVSIQDFFWGFQSEGGFERWVLCEMIRLSFIAHQQELASVMSLPRSYFGWTLEVKRIVVGSSFSFTEFSQISVEWAIFGDLKAQRRCLVQNE